MSSVFDRYFDEHLQAFSQLRSLKPQVEEAARRMADCLRAGGKLLFCGNGGSAADSQHLAAELTGRYIDDRRPLAAIALTTDSSALTCIGNDYGFDEIFERQLRALGRPGDCLIGISTSGRSRNVQRAMHSAESLGIQRIGLLGRDGGSIAPLCELALVVPSKATARIQEAHIFIGHTWCALIEELLAL
jgi:D-sedoheptulose 7-phosphate isomerase